MLYTQNIPVSGTVHSMDDSNFVGLSEVQEVQIFAKQMLLHRLFIGHYQERRYVDALKSYRDVIVVHETEDKLAKDLEIVRKRFQSLYRGENVWIGITGPFMIGAPAAPCVWVKLQNMAFGYYWFQIKQVKFCDNREVCLRLKCVRPINLEALGTGPSVSQPDFPASPTPEPSEEQCPSAAPSTSSEENVSPTSSFFNSLKNTRVDHTIFNVLSSLTSLMTLHNAKEVTSFTAVLLITCLTGACSMIKFLGDFTIKFMREMSVLIHAITPFLLAIVDFFTKCVGGFYILIAMLWRGTPVNFPKQDHFANRPPMLTYGASPPRGARYRPVPPMNKNGRWH
ncbi:uncharacterized protein [Anabrus simplex]|uniref:uncharacterized protein n=1 Tax=Anabrus simplex TaxID=316456 RepID=UPI0035A2CA9A